MLYQAVVSSVWFCFCKTCPPEVTDKKNVIRDVFNQTDTQVYPYIHGSILTCLPVKFVIVTFLSVSLTFSFPLLFFPPIVLFFLFPLSAFPFLLFPFSPECVRFSVSWKMKIIGEEGYILYTDMFSKDRWSMKYSRIVCV